MLSEEDIREQLSIAYLHTVAARAGYAWEPTRIDRDGIDGRVCARGPVGEDASILSPVLGFQLKATSSIEAVADGPIAFKLKQKNYDDLRRRHAEPRYLALFLLPRNPDDWLRLDANELILRRCMYWHSLLRAEASGNSESTTVYVPRQNVLDVQAMRTLMAAAAREESL
jgi:Domain of unknown function (DUF4365)